MDTWYFPKPWSETVVLFKSSRFERSLLMMMRHCVAQGVVSFMFSNSTFKRINDKQLTIINDYSRVWH